MIISKTPYRISFFGGGSDYPDWYNHYDGEVISTTIDKHIYISLRNLPPFFNHKYRICYSKIEEVKNISNIKHKVVREVLNGFKIKNGLEIHYDGDLPAKSGMGSSSTFVVGMINVLYKYLNLRANKRKLALDSVNFEKNTLLENVGSQDQVAASYGGFNNIKFKKDRIFTVSKIKISKKFETKLNNSLILVYTGLSRYSHNISSTYVKKINSSKYNQIKKILQYVSEAKKILKYNQLIEFGMLLDETWKVKKELSPSISNEKIDYLYSKGVKSGAVGGKLLGAGGGGFLLFCVPEQNMDKFKYDMRNNILIPIKFTSEGSKIILDSQKK